VGRSGRRPEIYYYNFTPWRETIAPGIRIETGSTAEHHIERSGQ